MCRAAEVCHHQGSCVSVWTCVLVDIYQCRQRRSVNVHTSRTGPLWHNKHFRLLLAGISAQETLVLVVLIVGATHRGIVVVALQREGGGGETNTEAGEKRSRNPLDVIHWVSTQVVNHVLHMKGQLHAYLAHTFFSTQSFPLVFDIWSGKSKMKIKKIDDMRIPI